jgi:hypothetical protein
VRHIALARRDGVSWGRNPSQQTSWTERGQRAPIKRKTVLAAKIVESRIPATASRNKAATDGTTPRHCNEGRCFLEAEARPESTGDHKTVCARTTPPTPSEIVEPRMAKRETVSLARCVEKEAAANVPRSPVSLPSPCQLVRDCRGGGRRCLH